jgi:hypothetical protein
VSRQEKPSGTEVPGGWSGRPTLGLSLLHPDLQFPQSEGRALADVDDLGGAEERPSALAPRLLNRHGIEYDERYLLG